MDEAAKYLSFRIARENNFSGPAEWLEPDAPEAKLYERDILYAAARNVNDVVRALTRQEMTDWWFLASVTEAKGYEIEGDHDWSWRLVAKWMSKHGFLDDLAAIVEQHYLPPSTQVCRLLDDTLCEAWNTPSYDVVAMLRDACAIGDVMTATRIITDCAGNSFVSQVVWRVRAWLTGDPAYED